MAEALFNPSDCVITDLSASSREMSVVLSHSCCDIVPPVNTWHVWETSDRERADPQYLAQCWADVCDIRPQITKHWPGHSTKLSICWLNFRRASPMMVQH